jgi:hypothetical protein
MQTSPRLNILLRTTEIILAVFLALAAAAFAGIYFYIALQRLRYPYELEWIEGGFADQVGRILAGRGVYTPPSVSFTPFLYTPLYFYLSALAAKIVGPGFFPLRLVSFLASLAAMGGIFWIVYREGRNLLASILAAGLLAASYRVTGAWLDVGRVDSLSIALLVFFWLSLPRGPSRFRWCVSGALAALMFLTKQTLLIALIPFFLVHFLQYRTKAVWMAAGFLIPVAAVTALFNLATGGWYSFYTLDLLGQQADWLGRDVILGFWTNDLFRHYAVTILFSLAGIFLLARRDRGEFWKWLSLLAGAVLCSFLARIKSGGYDNVLLPAAAAFGVLLGIGWNRLTESLTRAPALVRSLAVIALSVAAGYQYYHLRFNPSDQVPTPANYQAGENFIRYISQLPGDVYIPYHTYYAAMAGKPSYAHQSALWDVLRGQTSNRGKEILIRSITDAVRNRQFSTIILDGAGEWNFLYGLEANYSAQAQIIPSSSAPVPLTGWQISPQTVLLPLQSAQEYSPATRPARVFSAGIDGLLVMPECSFRASTICNFFRFSQFWIPAKNTRERRPQTCHARVFVAGIDGLLVMPACS